MRGSVSGGSVHAEPIHAEPIHAELSRRSGAIVLVFAPGDPPGFAYCEDSVQLVPTD